MLSSLAIIALFLVIGIYLGPMVRSAYSRIFPEPAYVNGDYSALYQQAGKSVVMFSTSTCPHCLEARQLLRLENIDYQDFVVDQSPDAGRQFKALGGSGVPLLFIADRRIVGFRESTIKESLALIRH